MWYAICMKPDCKIMTYGVTYIFDLVYRHKKTNFPLQNKYCELFVSWREAGNDLIQFYLQFSGCLNPEPFTCYKPCSYHWSDFITREKQSLSTLLETFLLIWRRVPYGRFFLCHQTVNFKCLNFMLLIYFLTKKSCLSLNISLWIFST